MKVKILIPFLFIIHAIVLSQTTEWEQNRFDGNNFMFYIGGFPRISSEFVDIDADGDYDCFIGTRDGNISYFENVQDSLAPSWKLITQRYLDINLSTVDRLKVRLIDIDSDSDLDLFIGGALSTPLRYYKNIGTKYTAEWELISGLFDDNPIGHIGKAIGFAMPHFNGKADGKLVKECIEEMKNERIQNLADVLLSITEKQPLHVFRNDYFRL